MKKLFLGILSCFESALPGLLIRNNRLYLEVNLVQTQNREQIV